MLDVICRATEAVVVSLFHVSGLAGLNIYVSFFVSLRVVCRTCQLGLSLSIDVLSGSGVGNCRDDSGSGVVRLYDKNNKSERI